MNGHSRLDKRAHSNDSPPPPPPHPEAQIRSGVLPNMLQYHSCVTKCTFISISNPHNLEVIWSFLNNFPHFMSYLSFLFTKFFYLLPDTDILYDGMFVCGGYFVIRGHICHPSKPELKYFFFDFLQPGYFAGKKADFKNLWTTSWPIQVEGFNVRANLYSWWNYESRPTYHSNTNIKDKSSCTWVDHVNEQFRDKTQIYP